LEVENRLTELGMGPDGPPIRHTRGSTRAARAALELNFWLQSPSLRDDVCGWGRVANGLWGFHPDGRPLPDAGPLTERLHLYVAELSADRAGCAAPAVVGPDLPAELSGLRGELKRLLSYLLKYPGARVDAIREHMRHADNAHTYTQLSRLRQKCRELLQGSPRRLTVSTEAGCVKCTWV
jgi:hypothetical protein